MENRKPNLTNYQKRIYSQYKEVLSITNLDADDVLSKDSQLITEGLKNIIEQIIRSEIIKRYTMIDYQLENTIEEYFFYSKGKDFNKIMRTKRYKGFHDIIQLLSTREKLKILCSIYDIPNNICKTIHAINDIRNVVAHSFFLFDLKKHKRLYKKINVFTLKGIEKFIDDAIEVHYFFDPWLKYID
jgi:hypothetical protein